LVADAEYIHSVQVASNKETSKMIIGKRVWSVIS
jgi:hypothetical protein